MHKTSVIFIQYQLHHPDLGSPPPSGWEHTFRTRERLDESEGEGAPPRLIRAASDDALFERAVSRFDTREDKRRPQPFARPGTSRDTLPGEGTWETMSPGGARLNANANCTIS